MPRPAGVTLLAIINWMFACGLVILALGFFVGFRFLGAIGAMGMPAELFTAIGTFAGILFLFFAAVEAFVGYGLWNLQEWARVVEIVLFAIHLLFSIPRLLFPHMAVFLLPRLVRMAIDGLVIWYLMQPQVRAAFAPR
ncbi:MAG TPA: DUF2127 domain-containing protein [Terriglobales bacterium]|nr:DUF2127 domain-containing protein [Terriglobales bacterium]